MKKKMYKSRNDGVLKVNRLINTAGVGNKPILKPEMIAIKFYRNAKVGSIRYANAMQFGRKISKVVDIDFTNWITENHQIEFSDKETFSIVQIQEGYDEYGNKSTVLSLEKISNEQS